MIIGLALAAFNTNQETQSMKRIITAAVVALALSACGGGHQAPVAAVPTTTATTVDPSFACKAAAQADMDANNPGYGRGQRGESAQSVVDAYNAAVDEYNACPGVSIPMTHLLVRP